MRQIHAERSMLGDSKSLVPTGVILLCSDCALPLQPSSEIIAVTLFYASFLTCSFLGMASSRIFLDGFNSL